MHAYENYHSPICSYMLAQDSPQILQVLAYNPIFVTLSVIVMSSSLLRTLARRAVPSNARFTPFSA